MIAGLVFVLDIAVAWSTLGTDPLLPEQDNTVFACRGSTNDTLLTHFSLLVASIDCPLFPTLLAAALFYLDICSFESLFSTTKASAAMFSL